MRFSVYLEKNVVSGTVLLDSITPLNIVLGYKVSFNGIVQSVVLKETSVNPSTKVFDFMFINPQYYMDLYVTINGVEQTVMVNNIEYSEESNPINDSIYLEKDLPDMSDVVVADEGPEVNKQEFGPIVNNSSVTNLASLSNFTADVDFIYNNNQLTFDVTKRDIKVSSRINCNNSNEVTISILGEKPEVLNLYAIRSSGPSLINSGRYYYKYGRHNFTYYLLSPSQEIDVELVYTKPINGYKSVRIKDIFVGKVSQYFGENESNRKMLPTEFIVNSKNLYTFSYDMISSFGLKTIATILKDDNKFYVQSANGKLLLSFLSGEETLLSEIVSNELIIGNTNIGIYTDEMSTKVYINNVLVKTYSENYNLPTGLAQAYIGMSDDTQSCDCNTEIAFAVYNENKYGNV